MATLERFRTNRDLLFWGLHAAGWAAYGLTQYAGALFYEKHASYGRVMCGGSCWRATCGCFLRIS